jgi:diguanylate cyclase (GGDEF)-like protein
VDAAQPVLSRVFDRTVMAVGAVVALISGATAVADGLHFSWATWLSVPLIVLIARFPLIIERPSGAIQIGFDSCVLAFVVSLLQPHDAMLMWSAGAVISQALSDFRRVAKIFNIGVMLTAGATAIALVNLLRGSARGTPSELAAVAIGCGAYFLIDYVVSEVSIALEEGVPLRPQLPQADVAIALACIVAVDSLGYLGALVVRGLPVWSVALLAVPIVTLLVAVSSVAHGRETARRMRVLFEVSTQVQGLQSESDVLTAVETGAQRLLKGAAVQLRSTPPGDGDVTARITGSSGDHWLVSHGRVRTRATAASDHQYLEALALVGDEALARLQMTREMSHLAQHDALTELTNRPFFLRRIERALERCRSRRGRVAVLFCDLDGFKRVNDWFGHAAGDALLVEVAETLRDAVGPRDTVARLGGDEFAVLVESVDPEDDLSALTDSVLRAVDRRYEFAGRFVTISTSIGVAFSDGAHSADQLVRNADIAMYEAKFAGRNQVVAYHPALGRERVRSLEQAEGLRQAIQNHELHLVYQPVVQSSTNRVVGVEALVRWSQNGRPVPTGRFISTAEESGLIDMLGDHVLELVAADAPALYTASGGELSIGVNVSAQQLRAPGFVASVLQARDALDGLTLVLEITERQVLGDDPLVLSVIAKLEASGVMFALDDFGIGYSSIGYLQQLAVQVLKTDRVFSASIDTDPRSIKLLLAMVEMARALGLDVVIEGIERESQLEVLRHHVGFADNLYLQGYLLAQPAPLAEIAHAVRASRSPALRAV